MAYFRSSGVSVPGATRRAVLLRTVSRRAGNNNFFMIWCFGVAEVIYKILINCNPDINSLGDRMNWDIFAARIKTFNMRTIAFREALREAMNEEMRRDDRVFLMGEEVAEY